MISQYDRNITIKWLIYYLLYKFNIFIKYFYGRYKKLIKKNSEKKINT